MENFLVKAMINLLTTEYIYSYLAWEVADVLTYLPTPVEPTTLLILTSLHMIAILERELEWLYFEVCLPFGDFE